MSFFPYSTRVLTDVGQTDTIAMLSSESNNRENSSNGAGMDCESDGRSDGALI